jgi:hypothetical protein
MFSMAIGGRLIHAISIRHLSERKLFFICRRRNGLPILKSKHLRRNKEKFRLENSETNRSHALLQIAESPELP